MTFYILLTTVTYGAKTGNKSEQLTTLPLSLRITFKINSLEARRQRGGRSLNFIKGKPQRFVNNSLWQFYYKEYFILPTHQIHLFSCKRSISKLRETEKKLIFFFEENTQTL